jgi:hypothetical protein
VCALASGVASADCPPLAKLVVDGAVAAPPEVVITGPAVEPRGVAAAERLPPRGGDSDPLDTFASPSLLRAVASRRRPRTIVDAFLTVTGSTVLLVNISTRCFRLTGVVALDPRENDAGRDIPMAPADSASARAWGAAALRGGTKGSAVADGIELLWPPAATVTSPAAAIADATDDHDNADADADADAVAGVAANPACPVLGAARVCVCSGASGACPSRPRTDGIAALRGRFDSPPPLVPPLRVAAGTAAAAAAALALGADCATPSSPSPSKKLVSSRTLCTDD